MLIEMTKKDLLIKKVRDDLAEDPNKKINLQELANFCNSTVPYVRKILLQQKLYVPPVREKRSQKTLDILKELKPNSTREEISIIAIKYGVTEKHIGRMRNRLFPPSKLSIVKPSDNSDPSSV